MSLLGNLFVSTLGRKFLMALTGLILIGFVIGHLVGNLQIFSHPDQINGYAAFLHNLGPLLWVVRLGLLAAVVIHIWAATALTLESRRARGPEAYGVKRWLQASWASRYIRWSGYVVLAFIIYHILHFTVGVGGEFTQADTHKSKLESYVMTADYSVAGFPVVKEGAEVEDVYTMVFKGFQNAPVAIFYIIAVGMLSFHLLHGMDSLFQTLGWRSHKWSPFLRGAVAAICLLYFLGNVAIPGAILTGLLEPHAASVLAGLK